MVGVSIFKKLLPKNEFSRNVLVLMTGTSVAQAIPIAISPVLTRIFTPEEFGLLALYSALVAVISVVASLRYELAIVQPQKDEDAFALLLLSIFITFLVAIIVFVVVFVFGHEIANALNNSDIIPWLYLLPFSILMSGVYQAFNYFLTRQESYKTISIAQVTRNLGGASGQMTLGWLHVAGALILGQIIGSLVSVVVMIKNVLPSIIKGKAKPDLTLIASNAKRYDSFPKFSALGALADSASVQMPIFMLTRYFTGEATGMFSLTFRVLNLPMTIMSQALSQVFFQRIATMQYGSSHLIRVHLFKLFVFLMMMMLPFVALIWFFGEPLFAFVFGEAWREAGRIAGVLVFAIAIRFPVSSLSPILTLDKNVKLGVLWQFIYLVTISSTLIFFAGEPLYTFLIAFTLHEVVLYSLYFLFILKGTANLEKEG